MAEDVRLSDCFREDHRQMGRAFHELTTALRRNDIARAKTLASELEATAGAHVAFEEQHLYPLLTASLGADAVRRLYAEHRDGLRVVRRLLDSAAGFGVEARASLITASERMESHIAECGELFHALRELDPATRSELLARLLEWRQRHPPWTRVAAIRENAPPRAAPTPPGKAAPTA